MERSIPPHNGAVCVRGGGVVVGMNATPEHISEARQGLIKGHRRRPAPNLLRPEFRHTHVCRLIT